MWEKKENFHKKIREVNKASALSSSFDRESERPATLAQRQREAAAGSKTLQLERSEILSSMIRDTLRELRARAGGEVGGAGHGGGRTAGAAGAVRTLHALALVVLFQALLDDFVVGQRNPLLR
jgi:hypothetical protein